MKQFLSDLRTSFVRGSIEIRFIFINAAIFVATGLVKGVLQLLSLDAAPLRLLELPASLNDVCRQPWALLTYMFIHADLWHLLINTLWIYWFGKLFLQFFSSKHLRGLFLLGGLSGGILYVAAYNLFPFFTPLLGQHYLVGASAAVLAVVTATAYREPNYRVSLFLLGSIKLKYIALAVVLFALLSITSENAGGHIAHLGGAFGGYLFAKLLERGTDLTRGINAVMDGLTGLFSPLSRKKPRMKVSYNNTERMKDYEYNARRRASSEEIDRILDKLRLSGYDSLNAEEKKRLFDASQR